MKPHHKYRHVFAIVRYDKASKSPLREDLIHERITVKKIVDDEDEANREVERLNKLNSDKSCVYFMQVTRYTPSDGCGTESTKLG